MYTKESIVNFPTFCSGDPLTTSVQNLNSEEETVKNEQILHEKKVKEQFNTENFTICWRRSIA